MADFVLLYSGGSMPETEEEQAQVMKLWDAWFAQIGSDPQGRRQPVHARGQDRHRRRHGRGREAAVHRLLDRDGRLARRGGEDREGSPVLHGGASVTVHETFEVM